MNQTSVKGLVNRPLVFWGLEAMAFCGRARGARGWWARPHEDHAPLKGGLGKPQACGWGRLCDGKESRFQWLGHMRVGTRTLTVAPKRLDWEANLGTALGNGRQCGCSTCGVAGWLSARTSRGEASGRGAHARPHRATLVSAATSQVGTGMVAVATVAPQTLVSPTSGTSQLGRCKSSLWPKG